MPMPDIAKATANGIEVTPRFLDTSGSYFGLEFPLAASPQIAPLERCYLADDSGRLLELRVSTTPAFVGIFAPKSP